MSEKEEELEALIAIFGDNLKVTDDRNIILSIVLDEGQEIKLFCHFPAEYPASKAIPKIQSSWLSESSTDAIENYLENISVHEIGNVIVFKWFDWIKDSVLDFLFRIGEPSFALPTAPLVDNHPPFFTVTTHPAPAASEPPLQLSVDLPEMHGQNISWEHSSFPEWAAWNVLDQDTGTLCGLWDELNDEHPIHDIGLALAMSSHDRLGLYSVLRRLDDQLLRHIFSLILATPISVPKDHSTLGKALQAAANGQSVRVQAGQHVLAQGLANPTRIHKVVKLFGERGSILVGGLHMSMDSGGEVQGLEVRGHCWVYGGQWTLADCTLRNRGDAAVVVSNAARVVLRDCLIGGSSKRRATHGVIVYGTAIVRLERCRIQRCGTAITTGGSCLLQIVDCEFNDNSNIFSVFRPGDTGELLHVQRCQVERCGRMWADERRPRQVECQNLVVDETLMGEAFWDPPSAGGPWDRPPPNIVGPPPMPVGAH